MKKCKWLAAALIAAVGLILSGCGNTSGAGGGGDEEKKTPVSPAILKADISKAAYVASTHIEKEKPVTVLQNVRAARDVDDAGDEKNPGTVVVVNTDGSINYDALGFTEGFKSLLKTEDAWLYDVVDVQQCDKGEDTNKGTYIMFDWTRTGWKYSDGTEAPDLGQVIFINKEGKLFDIFNNDGKARDGIAWNIKDEYGNEYIYFDNKGNIFILGFEWEYGKDWTYTVYRWNPTNGLKKFPLPVIVNNGLIRDFAISDDGSWIFVNAKYVEDCKYNDVYMINVNDGTRETLYRSAEGENDCVNKLCVGPDNKLYFYVDCQDVSKDGLFVLPKTTSGYSKDKLKRYMGLS